MGQLNFFFNSKEIQEKLEAIFATNEVEFFNGRFHDSPTPNPVNDISALDGFNILVLWLKNDLTEPRCSGKGGGQMDGKYLFDSYRDPIIELENIKLSNNLMSPGRIYYKAGWIENDVLRKKHNSWTSRIRRLFNKNSLKVNQEWRISRTIENWIKEDGGAIELGKKGMVVNKENINNMT